MSKISKFLTKPNAFVRDAYGKWVLGSNSTGQAERAASVLSSYVQLDSVLTDVRRLSPEVAYVYFPWIQGHGDALMRKLSCKELPIAPLTIFSTALSHKERVGHKRAIQNAPDLYRRLCVRVLLSLPPTVRGVLFSMDWTPAMRQAVAACKEVGLRSILVPHEGLFADVQRYYLDPRTGADHPVCDHALVWGKLQADIFHKRGYPQERITITGAPKFDAYHDYRPELSREQFCRVYRLDPERPIILFACQPLDSQFDFNVARESQQNAIRHLADYCARHETQLLIRQPPNGENVLVNLQPLLMQLPHVQLDNPSYVTTPEESIFHSAVVCSINSTMLFEAALLNRPSISTKYVAFDSLWEQAGGAVAVDEASLSALLDQMLSASPPVLDTCPSSRFAKMFSPAGFDGQATQRVREALSQFAVAPPQVYDLSNVDHLFQEHLVVRAPQGTCGYHNEPSELVRHVPAMLGYRKLEKPASMIVASGMDIMAHWGTLSPDHPTKSELRDYAHRLGIPCLVLEDGLVRSLQIGLSGTPTLSVMLDRRAAYYDATQRTSLEDYLNSDFALSEAQLARVRQCMALIAKHRVSKYNHAPDQPLQYPKGSVLVLDQRFGDLSVIRGMGSDAQFREMLIAAHDENPEALILVKRHPDAMSGGKKAYYSNSTMRQLAHLKRLRLLDFETNPHALFDVCSKVYTVSSGMGFEALVRGLEVHCFGMPFYAGWGATKDRQHCSRRTQQRSVEDIFHAALLVHSVYYQPEQQRPCDLEDLVEYIGKTRAIRS